MASRPLQPRQSHQPGVVTLRTDARPGTAEARILELETELEVLRAKVGTALAGLLPTDYMIMTLDARGNVTSWNTAARRMLQPAGPEPPSHLGPPADTVGQVVPASLAVRLDSAFGAARTGETWYPRGDGVRVRAHEILVPLLNADRRPQGSLRIIWEASDQPREDAAPARSVRRWAKTPVRGVVLAVALSGPIYVGIGLAIRWMLS